MRRDLVISLTFVIAAMAAPDARAADAGRGEQLAKSHCASCHIVTGQPRGEVAVAPPFAVIGGKYAFNQTAIRHAILGPHPKMNFAPSPAVAADIAAYIGTLSY